MRLRIHINGAYAEERLTISRRKIIILYFTRAKIVYDNEETFCFRSHVCVVHEHVYANENVVVRIPRPRDSRTTDLYTYSRNFRFRQ